jgi:hypothetical protein
MYEMLLVNQAFLALRPLLKLRIMKVPTSSKLRSCQMPVLILSPQTDHLAEVLYPAVLHTPK